jgi:hypothetical protein
MNTMLSEARAKVGHRLAMHLRVDLFQLRNSTPMVSFTFDDPSPYGCSPALLAHALEAASRRKIPVLTMAEAMRCARA